MQNNIILKQINYFCKHTPECALNIAYKNNKVFILVKGPEGSLYEDGEYVIELECKHDYPFSPPSIKVLTPSGRFVTGEKICTSFSDFHPNTWSPAINFNIIATSIVSFMLDKDSTHIGSMPTVDNHILNYTKASINYNKTNTFIQSIEWLKN